MSIVSSKDKTRIWLGLKLLMTVFACLGVMVSLSLIPTRALAQGSQSSNCGAHGGGFGPFDYRGADPQKLYLVESAHFTPPVEALISGSSATNAGPDLDYTLRAFPNHHRALLATIRYGEKYKTLSPPGMRYPVECWFVRALQFRPDDYIVRMIYASFLNNQNRKADALKQLAVAENEAKDNSFTHYNIGLVYFDMKEYDKALKQAHRAIALGFTRPELRDQLTAAGKWRDPPAAENVPSSN